MRLLIIESEQKALSILISQIKKHDDTLVFNTIDENCDIISLIKKICPHIVLVDFTMGGMKRLDTIYRLRTAFPQIGIIAIGLRNTKSCKIAALESGANKFILSSNLSTQLFPALKQIATTTC